MNSEIICISAVSLPEEHSSFLTGYISKKLFELGHRTTFESLSSPNIDEVEALIKQALSRSDLIIVLGGIESETNSVGKRALSNITGIPLVTSEVALHSIKEYCADIGINPTTEQLASGIMPKTATVFKNDNGIYPGFALDYNDKKILMLPYSEGELTHMFEGYVIPLLNPHGVTVTHTVNVIGMLDEEIENKLSSLLGKEDFAVIPEKRGAEYAIRVSAAAASKEDAEKACMRAVASVKFALGKAAFAIDSKGLQFEVVSLLAQKKLTVSTAESCTAGMTSELITDVGGSSKVFEYGISAYSNRIKREVLKVPDVILDQYSAISAETAKHMAINVRALAGASIGVAITGNAGPSPSEGKPVGLVYVAIADSHSYIVSELRLSDKLSRDEIREIASAEALSLLLRYAAAYPQAMSGMSNYTQPSTLINPSATSEKALNSQDFLTESLPDTNISKDDYRLNDEPTVLRFDRVDEDDLITEEYRFVNSGKFSEISHNILNKLIGIARSFFPWKGDPIKKIFIKIGFIVSIITFVASSSLLVYNLTSDNIQRNIITKAQQNWNFDGSKNDNNVFTSFEPYYEDNKDIRGWISMFGAGVNNPIYQTTDNEFYLNHNMYKEKSRYGALFFDYRCDTSSSSQSQNLIIYGHEMKDGSMFGNLKKYKSLSFYKQNPNITLTQLEEQSVYKIFAVMVLNATPADDNGYMFNYITPSFKSQNAFLNWIDEARERSIINTAVDVQADDRILTLVTCINDFDNARFVIMARKTRDNEGSAILSNEAILNPNPRYPQAWYDKYGLDGYVKSSSSNTEANNDNSSDTSDTSSEPSDIDQSSSSSTDINTSSANSSSHSSSSSSDSSQTVSSATSTTPNSSSQPSTSEGADSSETDSSNSEASDSGQSSESSTDSDSNAGSSE